MQVILVDEGFLLGLAILKFVGETVLRQIFLGDLREIKIKTSPKSSLCTIAFNSGINSLFFSHVVAFSHGSEPKLFEGFSLVLYIVEPVTF